MKKTQDTTLAINNLKKAIQLGRKTIERGVAENVPIYFNLQGLVLMEVIIEEWEKLCDNRNDD